MPEPPVAAPDHAAFGSLVVLLEAIEQGRALLPNGALLLEVDAGLNDGMLWKSDASMLLDQDDLAALRAIPALLAGRQQLEASLRESNDLRRVQRQSHELLQRKNAELVAERQQDKQRIERLEKSRQDAVDRLLSDPGRAAIAAVDGLRKILPELKIEEDEQIRRILDWIGVAGDDNLPLAERVRILALEMATRQGYSLDEAERLCPPAFVAALAGEEDAS